MRIDFKRRCALRIEPVARESERLGLLVEVCAPKETRAKATKKRKRRKNIKEGGWKVSSGHKGWFSNRPSVLWGRVRALNFLRERDLRCRRCGRQSYDLSANVLFVLRSPIFPIVSISDLTRTRTWMLRSVSSLVKLISENPRLAARLAYCHLQCNIRFDHRAILKYH